VELELVSQGPADVKPDLFCFGLFDGDEIPGPFADALGAGDARSAFKRTSLLRQSSPERILVVGLGARDDFDPERARVAAAIASRQAASLDARRLEWSVRWVPDSADAAAVAAALVEGTELASYRFDRYRASKPDDEPRPEIETLVLVGDVDGLEDATHVALVAARAANRARELQNLPANVVTPSYLADRAGEIAAAHERVSAEILGPKEIEDLGMGGLIAVARGSEEEPRLIVLRHEGSGDTLGLVGKAVTFDSGGISIKPSARMHEMKMDMSGGAAVIEAMSAIAELELDVSVLAVVPSTENMPSGHALKPGDVLTQHNGKTVEIINTDAEGRLILADALSWCAEQGADRIVDLATLTGAVLTALGSTYAGLVSNDDEWAARVLEAGEASGELAWRLPLHEEYKALTRGSITDLVNASEKRKASTIYAASFLEEFVDSKPWVHLDIAGTAWDVGREYVGKGATGFGVRLLVELARELEKR
jgi:leucyl aminopeptidase